jgi:DNA-binding LacI/PurR family transcriptional regulator
MPYVMVQIPKTSAAPSPAPRSVPTSADVARLAGVSRATVSYVLNNTSAVRISEPTRRRVHEAAKELGYVPHAAARSLRAGHSRMVLMPAPTIPVGPLYSQFFNELQWALSRLDYTVVQYGGPSVSSGDEAARAWAELRPVAVLVPGAGLGPEGVEPSSSAPAPGPSSPSAPNGSRARTPCSWTTKVSATAPGAPVRPRLPPRRSRGARGARHGDLLPAPPRRRAARPARHGRHGDRTPARLRARRAASRTRRALARFGLDAVFAYNDEYAMLLMRALQDEGIGIPEDTAVIGADDLMLGRLLRPRLSTVHIELPSGRAGRAGRPRGARARRPAGQHELLGATVVHRESS